MATKYISELNLIRLDDDDSIPIDDLITICEENRYLVTFSQLLEKDPAFSLGKDVAVLSWRWDIEKTPTTTLDDLRNVRSEKVRAFVNQARQLKFKFAWCDYTCIPQFPTNHNLLMEYVKSSNILFETCKVFVMDVEEIEHCPGIKIPTPEYMSRLWTTAEMSAMLTNSNVDYSTFIQISQFNQRSMRAALTFDVFNYQSYMAGRKQLPHIVRDYHGVRSIVIFLRNFGTSNGLVDDFLRSLCETDAYDNQALLTNQEQDRVIREYVDSGRQSKEKAAFLHLVSKPSRKTISSFEPKTHYKALLILMFDLFESEALPRKWNRALYLQLLATLNQLPSTGGVNAARNEHHHNIPILKFSYPGDDKIVSEMIASRGGINQAGVSLVGIDLPKIPNGHAFTWKYSTTGATKLQQLFDEHHSIDFNICRKIIFSFFAPENSDDQSGGAHASITFSSLDETNTVTVKFSLPGNDCTIQYDTKENANTLSQYTVPGLPNAKDDELILVTRFDLLKRDPDGADDSGKQSTFGLSIFGNKKNICYACNVGRPMTVDAIIPIFDQLKALAEKRLESKNWIFKSPIRLSTIANICTSHCKVNADACAH
jgi:hypothetical protein